MTNKINWNRFHTIVFDFDGVFTDNCVYVDDTGRESVKCSREDSLGINILKSFVKATSWNLHMFILSKEKNPVVSHRGKKLGIEVHQGVDNKVDFIDIYLQTKLKLAKNQLVGWAGVIYLGNDLNDLHATIKAGYSFCPCNAHPLLAKKASQIASHKGGEGFVRFVAEELSDTKNNLPLILKEL